MRRGRFWIQKYLFLLRTQLAVKMSILKIIEDFFITLSAHFILKKNNPKFAVDYHFVEGNLLFNNLIKMGYKKSSLILTGNPVYDKVFQKFSSEKEFAGTADTSRVGIFGHSFGGCTSVASAYNDNRIDAVFGLDAYFLPLSENMISKDLNKPFAHLGQPSWGSSNNYAVMEALAKKNSKLSTHFAAQGSKHYDFTDFSQFTRLTKKFGSGKINPKTIRIIMNTLLLDFFNATLKTGKKFNPQLYEQMFPEITQYIY